MLQTISFFLVCMLELTELTRLQKSAELSPNENASSHIIINDLIFTMTSSIYLRFLQFTMSRNRVFDNWDHVFVDFVATRTEYQASQGTG